jgi:hypothetical protein
MGRTRPWWCILRSRSKNSLSRTVYKGFTCVLPRDYPALDRGEVPCLRQGDEDGLPTRRRESRNAERRTDRKRRLLQKRSSLGGPSKRDLADVSNGGALKKKDRGLNSLRNAGVERDVRPKGKRNHTSITVVNRKERVVTWLSRRAGQVERVLLPIDVPTQLTQFSQPILELVTETSAILFMVSETSMGGIV